MLRRLSSFLVCLFALAGCARSPHPAGVLRIATDTDASTLDPIRAYDTSSINFVRVIYRGLVDYDAKANIVNAVASERRVSPDGKTYTFKLRHDVRFYQSRRVVAEDFRYSMERVLDPANQSDGLALFKNIVGSSEYSDAMQAIEARLAKTTSAMERDRLTAQKNAIHVSGIVVRGEDEVAFVLKQPDSTFLNYLALPFSYVVPREWVEELAKQGKTLNENPKGCGPFALDEWVHDAHLYLKKNPDYYERGLPHADRIEVQMGNSTTLQQMRFEQGSNDILALTDAFPPEFLRLSKDPKWQPYLMHAPMMDVRYLCMNTEVKPFDNLLVRKAMNYAINRERIALFRAGRATIARGILPPGMPAYNAHLRGYSFDPDKARQLFKQAGLENGFKEPVTLWYSTAEPWYASAAQSIQEDLKNVGLDIAIKPVTYPELKTKAGKRHNIQMSILGWIQDFPDPSNFLDVLFNGKNITDSASQNRAFYSNPKVNALLDKAAMELNKPKRLAMYGQVEQMIMDDAPWVPLNHTERYILRQPWVSGYVLDPMWSARYEQMGVKAKDGESQG